MLHRTLPDGIHLSFARGASDISKEDESFFVLQLVGPLPPSTLRNLAEHQIADHLLKLPGIANIEIHGGEERELRATLRSSHLETHNTSITTIRQGLAGALRDHGYGTLPVGTRQTLLHRTAHRNLEPLPALPISSDTNPSSTVLRLADLGRLERSSAPLQSISRIDGNPVVTLTLHRTPGSHLLRVAKEVRKAVEEIRKDLPAGTELLIADDRSEDVRKQLRDLAVRGGLGFLLLLVVLLTMLRSGKAVAIALFAVLVSLSAAIILFKPLDLTLNVLTIAGLVLLFGLLVDNAVVVIERLQAELAGRRGGGLAGYTAAARRAVRAVWLPLLGGTLSTCAVFLPMVYLSGELRSLFSSFAVLSALTLGFSLVASVVLIPNLGQSLRGPTPPKVPGTRRARTVLLVPYRLATRHPRLSFVLLLLAIGLPTPLLPDYIEEPSEGWRSEADRDFAARYNRTIGSDRFREARLWLDPLLGGVTRPFLKNVELGKRWDFPERPEVRVWIQLPAGSGIHRADERIRPFEDEARKSPAVKRTLVHVAGRVARMTVLFHDEAMDTDEPYLLRERLIAHALQIAGMEVSVSGLVPMGFYSGLGQVSGFTVHAFGPTYEKLEEVSKSFARRLERYPRVAEVDIHAAGRGQPPAREVIRFHWGADAVARTGLSARELAEVLRPQLWRETPDFYADLEGDPRMPVRIVMEGAEQLDLDTLLHRPLAAGPGGPVRLADHAELTIEKDPPVIERINQQYRRTLRVYYRGPYRMGKEMLDKEIAGMTLPPGYRLERPRWEFFDEEVQRQFFWLILGTVALVFLVIAAVLESWRLAAVVMLSVPLSWIGIALAFLLTGQNFAEGAFIGVVLTIGIAVNDAILLADGYRRLRLARPGTPVPRLALLALRQRLRPMWTTTLTSIAGMLPLLVIPDAGNFWVGLAVTVVGGLSASTLLAPAATAALLAWAARRRQAASPIVVPELQAAAAG
jgi:multidrug efflux pump subunit AcrB